MKISDFILRYPTVGWYRNAICRVRIFTDQRPGVTVLLTDLGDKNPGLSITNSVEFAREFLIDKGYIGNDVRIIQHHEQSEDEPCELSIVTFEHSEPEWEEISPDDLAHSLGCPKESFLECTSPEERLVLEVERTRNCIDPYIDFPPEETPDVIVRRDDIRRRMISKGQLHELVQAKASERRLQGLIKRDLSLIAEVYAPEEEYLAFSEFPVGNGKADFALFSGRSRMKVTLIEIKGADFAIVNRTGYKNFAAKMNEAGQQIRTRLGDISREHLVFQQFVHEVRKKVEAGESCYNSLVGPAGNLSVDPQKDIIIRYALIGGRTTDDIRESKLRHDYESPFNHNIMIESWDSWLKKLRRS